MTIKKRFVLPLLLLAFTALTAAAPNSWLHVRVDSNEGEKVRVNVPLNLVSTVLPLIKEKHLTHGRLRTNRIALNGGELTVDDLRQIWASIKSSGSYELANIETSDANIHVVLDGDYLTVESLEGSREQVHVKVPVAVVDALLSGDGDELDVLAAVEALERLGGQQLVMVEADDSTVKIWIDQKSEGE